jgi:predicted AlkP superfamily pyrophosphatase or phosphodiesterase
MEAMGSVVMDVLTRTQALVRVRSVFPPKTPVCFASMFTGAPPEVHGITTYVKPVLECDTLFDALVRAGKRVAIVAVRDSSVDLMFRGRDLDYFSEPDDGLVTRRAEELIHLGKHDFMVVYHQQYDDILHRNTPDAPEALEAAGRHLRSFGDLADAVESAWASENRLIVFAPDHGAHVDPATGRGTHGEDIPDDMQVLHFYGMMRGVGQESKAPE